MPEPAQASPDAPQTRRPLRSVRISVIAVFSALIAVATILSLPMPPPLGEITWAPPIYMALSVLAGPWPALVATALGSLVGESYNVAFRGFPAIYAPGIVWARAPEALIIGWARKKGWKMITIAMIGATIYETLAFFIPDWFFYANALFGYGTDNTGVSNGFIAASFDFLTLVDLVFVPVALGLISAAAPAFRRLGFD